tara:strand:+ start:246 stop:521 length:276 start_codon:yes stop_codon:yes gene_type:complete
LEIIHFLFDLSPSNPSCAQWGIQGELFIPPIIGVGDDLSPFRDLFPDNPAGGSKYPITIFINHNMQIISIQYKPTEEQINTIIQSMLDSVE